MTLARLPKPVAPTNEDLESLDEHGWYAKCKLLMPSLTIAEFEILQIEFNFKQQAYRRKQNAH